MKGPVDRAGGEGWGSLVTLTAAGREVARQCLKCDHICDLDPASTELKRSGLAHYGPLDRATGSFQPR